MLVYPVDLGLYFKNSSRSSFFGSKRFILGVNCNYQVRHAEF